VEDLQVCDTSFYGLMIPDHETLSTPVILIGVTDGQITEDGSGRQEFPDLRSVRTLFPDINPGNISFGFTPGLPDRTRDGRRRIRFETWAAARRISREGCPHLPEFVEYLNHLQASIERWLEEIQRNVLRGTLLNGIAAKAVNSFEHTLRDLVKVHLAISGLSYTELLKDKMRGIPVDRLTMGQAIRSLSLLDQALTDFWITTSPRISAIAENRSLVAGSVELLNRIRILRNRVHHEARRYRADQEPLLADTKEALVTMNALLAEPVFQVLVAFDHARTMTA
jgi:hypothetical protein